MADIYVDSFPITSLTSAIEAGMAGVPVITACRWSGSARILCSSGSGLDYGVIATRDPEELQGGLNKLVRNSDHRRQASSRSAAALRRGRIRLGRADC